jgi:hypothetical protein
MTAIGWDFDATQHAPRQALGAHPVGKFPFRITAIEGKPSKAGDNSNSYIGITFTTPAGTIIKRYNVWNSNQQAVDIAHGELSALSYATGRLRWSLRDEGRALLGGEGMIEVAPQIDKGSGQPNAMGYVEVKKVFDIHGNDPVAPGGALAPAPQQGYQQPVQPQAAPNQWSGAPATSGYMAPAQPQQQTSYAVDNGPGAPAPQGWQGGAPPPATPVPSQSPYPSQPGASGWGGPPAQQQPVPPQPPAQHPTAPQPNWQQQAAPQGGTPNWQQPR